jgi:phosphate transport system substrate-binding protein
VSPPENTTASYNHHVRLVAYGFAKRTTEAWAAHADHARHAEDTMQDSLPDHRPPRLTWTLALALAFSLSGCGESGNTSKTSPTPATSGEAETVEVDGSSTVYPITTAAQESFRKIKPGVEIIIGNSGTGGGFTNYNKGGVDIVDASRPATAKEEAKAKESGLNWLKFVVGYDGITVVVNPKNTFINDLTVQQLKQLFEPDSKVKTWKDLDPSWPDRQIKLYSPDDKSGTFDFFTEAIVGKAKSQRKDVHPSADDNTLVIGVAGDPDAIGYFGFAYFKEYSEKLRAIPLKKGSEQPPVAPSPETILAKEYPLSRPLFIYVKKSSYRRAGVKSFVDYYLENVARLATEARYVAPTADDIKSNAAEANPAEAKPEEVKPAETKPEEAKPTP